MTTYTRETLLAAYKAGERDFIGADLRAADLRAANLINCMGVYSARPPFMSSRNDALYAGVFERGGFVLLFTAGCKINRPAAELRALVSETHGDNAHAVQYNAAITFIEVCFASDLAEGRFAAKTEPAAEAQA